MAPLSCASVSDLYGSNFGLSAEQIAEQTLKNNQKCAEENSKYQQNLKETQIAGKIENENNSNYQSNDIGNERNERNDRVSFARRPAYTDSRNIWPTHQGLSMFNRFQNVFGNRENFGVPSNDSECLQQLVSIANEIQLMTKIIMLVLVLLFIIRILEKRN